jgi:integrase
MSRGLTDTKLRALVASPPAERMELKDGVIDGLILRVGPRGRPTWSLRFRVRGAGGTTERGLGINGPKYHRVTLGHYPAVSIRSARAQAAGYIESIERGEDPIKSFRDRAVDRKDTVAVMISDYLAHAKQEMRSWRNAQWILNRHVLQHWGERPVGKITERDARTLIAEIQRGGATVKEALAKPANGAASEARKWGSMLFEWGRRHGRVKLNPFKEVPAPKLRPRQRFLTMDEARNVWRAAAKLRSPWGPAVQLLMLTGCRESEICSARWPWLDEKEGTLVIPADHYKSGRDFLVPLPSAARKILAGLPKWDGGSFVLSTTDGFKPIAGVNRKVLDQLHVEAEKLAGASIPRFALHDLRRTVRTHLSRLGVTEVVAELVLGHSLKGLQARYNVYGYAPEKGAALELWAAELTA